MVFLWEEEDEVSEEKEEEEEEEKEERRNGDASFLIPPTPTPTTATPTPPLPLPPPNAVMISRSLATRAQCLARIRLPSYSFRITDLPVTPQRAAKIVEVEPR